MAKYKYRTSLLIDGKLGGPKRYANSVNKAEELAKKDIFAFLRFRKADTAVVQERVADGWVTLATIRYVGFEVKLMELQDADSTS